MHILLTTFGFLLIFALATTGQFRRLISLSIVEKAYQAHYDAAKETLAKVSLRRAQKNFRSYSPTNNTSPERHNLVSTLQIYCLVSPATTASADNKKRSVNLILRRLMSTLYGTQPFFIEAKEKNQRLEDDILNKLFEKAEELQVYKERNLANIELGDDQLQLVLYKMLKGSCDEGEADINAGNYPSLFEFISINRGQSKPLSIYLAGEPLLHAVFQNPTVVNQILKERISIHKTLKKDKNANKIALAQQFKDLFKNSLPPDIEPTLIDFNVSKTDPE